MDRRTLLHGPAAAGGRSPGPDSPASGWLQHLIAVGRAFKLVGVLGGGIAVIATASLLALQVQ